MDFVSDLFYVPLNASMTYPDGQIWTKDSDKAGLSFEASDGDGAFSAYIDGSDTRLAAENYSISGNTVTLKPAYLNSLGAGEHKIKVEVNSFVFRLPDYIDGTFTVKAAEESSNYKMVSGNGATWTKGSTTGLTFVSDAPFDEFAAPYGAVVINDEAIDAKYYTAEAGSTKITLKPEYLQTLEPKEYKISIASENGVAQGTFTVKAADDKSGTNDEKTSPKTGVDTTPLAATTLVFAIGVLAAGAYIFRTRKEGVK